jgi:hypothetical protein
MIAVSSWMLPRAKRFVAGAVAVSCFALSAKAEPAADRVSTRIGTNRVSITVSGGERIIKANGLPDHTPGSFPRPHNPNTISPQAYDLKVPVAPAVAARVTPAGHALFGIAINGVPFDPGTAEFWNDDRSSGWNYEANTGFLDLGLDQNNAHVQPTGAYHYHAMPQGLVARLITKADASSAGSGTSAAATDTSPMNAGRMLLLGWAADGFPIYNNYEHTIPNDPKSPLKKVHSSYRLKQGQRAGGPGGKFDGHYTADFEFVKSSGDLDECNGGFGVTPEFPQGIYHYSITEEFPFIPRVWRGTPDSSFLKRGPRPGGRPPGKRPPGPRRDGFDRAQTSSTQIGLNPRQPGQGANQFPQ